MAVSRGLDRGRARFRHDTVTSEKEQSVQLSQDARPRPAERPPLTVSPRPKPSVRRSQERRAVRNHERLVAAWLRSLSVR